MIREVIHDAVALVVFTLGGALSGLTLLKLLCSNARSITAHVVDFCLGLSGAVVFISLSEIYYDGVVTYYTLSCFAIGYVGVLAFLGEGKKIILPDRVKGLIAKVKTAKPKSPKPKQKKKRAKRVSKSLIKVKGIN